MKTRKILVAFIFLAVSAQKIFAQEDSIYTILQTVETLYDTGSYITAELEARRLLEYSALNDSIRVTAHKYIAFSLIAQGKTELAKEQFISMLKLVPDYDLDPVYTSPKILIIFRETQQRFPSLRRIQNDADGYPIKDGHDATTYRTIIFPGWEQLFQNRKTTGRVFLGAGIATLGAGITFELLRSSARNNYLSETNSSEINNKYSIYNRYYKAEIFSFIAFAVVYIASEIDVLYAQGDQQFSIESRSSSPQGTTFTFNFRF
jgi:hypothetical protein